MDKIPGIQLSQDDKNQGKLPFSVLLYKKIKNLKLV